MDTKQIERDILFLVYDRNEFANVVNSESPDFRIQHKEVGTIFGVEITKFYYSEANARLKNIPNYFSEIVEQNHFRHKEDEKSLKVENITLTSKEGKPKGNARVIIQELPSPEHFANMIGQTIRAKNKKFNNYDQELTHINLIILDTECRFRSVSIDKFYRSFFTEQLKETIYSSEFREIFLVTRLEGDRKVYFPLKMLVLLGDFFLFGSIVLDYPLEPDDKSSTFSKQILAESNTMEMFAAYLKAKTTNIFISVQKDRTEVFWGNTSIFIDNGQINIHDHADHALPKNIQVIKQHEIKELFTTSTFRKKEHEVLESLIFQTEIVYDTKGDFEF